MYRGYERGSLTIFIAVMILLLLTIMIVYAARVGVMETKGSGNEVYQKQAFQVAESAVEQGLMYLLANASRILSDRENVFPDGTAFTGDGWFASGDVRWQSCTAEQIAMPDHPCGGEIPATLGTYYYDDPATLSGVDSLPVSASGFPVGATARLSATLCFVDLANPVGGNCGAAPTSTEEEAGASLVINLLAYGYSDCLDTSSPASCKGKATIAQPISNFKTLAGSPTVTFVAKSTFPPTGSAEIVGNPNGGGVGVPLSVWANENPSCAPETTITSSGSWQTCELEEWYHSGESPEGVICIDNNCKCGPGGNDSRYFLSWKNSNDSQVGIDIVSDPNFPCDLFETFFGVPKELHQQIKSTARVLADCSSLGPQSHGLIWISGSECDISANLVVGSPHAPVILISAANVTTFNGGSNVMGLVYIFDGEGNDAQIRSNGSAAIYGSVIVDAEIDSLQGDFQVVYNSEIMTSASGIGGLGPLNGGWRDFGLPNITW